MRRPRHAREQVNHERWLVSYADFITLLFAFFVVMFASARLDQKKAARLAVAIDSAFHQLGVFDTTHKTPGVLTSSHDSAKSNASMSLARSTSETHAQVESDHKPIDIEAIRSELEKALAPEIKRQEVGLRIHPDGLIVSLREIGFFDSGSATIKPNAEGAFRRVTDVLRRHICAIRIEGHTDTIPIHTLAFRSNWELSTARATEVVRILIEKYSFAADRLSAAGYAQFRPVANNAGPEGRQLNRRVDVVILAATIPSINLETVNA